MIRAPSSDTQLIHREEHTTRLVKQLRGGQAQRERPRETTKTRPRPGTKEAKESTQTNHKK